jgi:hypothetical protein
MWAKVRDGPGHIIVIPAITTTTELRSRVQKVSKHFGFPSAPEMGHLRCDLTPNSIQSFAQLFPILKVLLCYGAVGTAPLALSKTLKLIRANRNLPVELLECCQNFILRWSVGPIERQQRLLEAELKLLELKARCAMVNPIVECKKCGYLLHGDDIKLHLILADTIRDSRNHE